jgi:hypothetical protein
VLFKELNQGIFEELMAARGWKSVTQAEAMARGHVGLVFADGTFKWTPELYKLRSDWKCRLQVTFCPGGGVGGGGAKNGK